MIINVVFLLENQSSRFLVEVAPDIRRTYEGCAFPGVYCFGVLQPRRGCAGLRSQWRDTWVSGQLCRVLAFY